MHDNDGDVDAEVVDVSIVLERCFVTNESDAMSRLNATSFESLEFAMVSCIEMTP